MLVRLKSFPSLVIRRVQRLKGLAQKEVRRHPVSGSEHHLSLYDRLHEKNVKKDEEALRRVTNVKELKGKTSRFMQPTTTTVGI